LVALSCCALLIRGAGEAGAEARKADLESFELVWKTLRDRYWDQSMAGLDWQSVHDRYLPQVQGARSKAEARGVINSMIRLLPSSHLAIIPGELYRLPDTKGSLPVSNKGSRAGTSASDTAEDDSGVTGLTVGLIGDRVVVERVEAGSSGAKANVRPGWIINGVDGQSTRELFTSLGEAQQIRSKSLLPQIVESWLSGPPRSTVNVTFIKGDGKSALCPLQLEEPAGEPVRFGNLPPEHVQIEHRTLEGGIGYIRLNLFLDPVGVMPEIEKAIHQFKDAPGIVLDLRNNPGGLAIMAMGIAGWFVSEDGARLGTMTSRDSTLNFVINPRLNPYRGRLAILVNGGSASTSEILAQGLRDLGRARVFGTRTAGAALPSNIIQLPNGDRFQYPEANYISAQGRVLEGNGVELDTVVAPTIPALLAGKDLPLEAAREWSKEK